jgi:NAD(P)-dependent dehydrogenase (short-subunit alcohol dehydrogenase family)
MIFVTDGAGYIGSHTCVELLDAGRHVTVFDNFSNSHPEAITRVERITGKKVRLVRGDIRDRAALVAALRESGARPHMGSGDRSAAGAGSEHLSCELAVVSGAETVRQQYPRIVGDCAFLFGACPPNRFGLAGQAV